MITQQALTETNFQQTSHGITVLISDGIAIYRYIRV